MDAHFVKTLKLYNFRSYRTHEMCFTGNPTLFFGPNGAGKTNILEAISLLSPGRGMRGCLSKDMEHQYNGEGWKVDSVIATPDSLHEVNIECNIFGKRNLRINDKPSSQIALGKIIKIIWLTPMMDRIWVESLSERRRFLDRIVMNYEPNHAKSCSVYNKALYQRNRLLKDRVKDNSWYQAVETIMADSGYRIDQARRRALVRLYDMQLIVSQTSKVDFPIAKMRLSNQEFKSVSDLGEMLARSRNNDMMSGRSLVGPHLTDLLVYHESKKIEARNCSTGEQKSLLISLFISNAFSLKDFFGSTPILLLDEIVSHLDVEKLDFLFDELERLKAQTFFTATESYSFDRIKERLQIFQIC